MRGLNVWALSSVMVPGLVLAGSIVSVVPLPNQATVSAFQRDAAGNLYLGGSVAPAHPRSQGGTDAFVAKLSSDGSKVIFWTVLSGSQSQNVTALTLAADGSILVTGPTYSTDFPVTKDAAEPQLGAGYAFLARLDTNGNVVYASFLETSAPVTPLAITSDSSGAVYITGGGVVPSAQGTLPSISCNCESFFLLKLDATGKQVFVTGGIGGSAIALDTAGFIYVAGFVDPNYPLPVTPGAFQTTPPAFVACASTMAFVFPCSNQFVAKVNPAASALVYATWLSGNNSRPNSLSVDSVGNAILAGTTGASDYPVTLGAFQTSDFAFAPPFDNTNFNSFGGPPPATGYVTKLNATGTGLVFSTLIGGSGQDVIDSMTTDSEGNLYLAGLTMSPDFPGLNGLPDGCRPNYVYPVPFLTRLSADGSALTATQLAFGSAVPMLNGSTIPNVNYPVNWVFDSHGKATAAIAGSLWTLDLFAPSSPLICIVDAADHAPLAQVAPGQLVTLYGNGIGSTVPTHGQPANGQIPTSLGDGVLVKFNGVAAPILYSGPDQINVQVPYEIAGQTTARLEISGPGGGAAGQRDFGVVASAPAVFVNNVEYATCGKTVTNSLLPVAHNADGSLNSCDNPAASRSIVTLVVNGLGPATPGLTTGAITSGPATKLNLSLTAGGQGLSLESVPGYVNAVWHAKLLMVNLALSNLGDTWVSTFTMTIGGVPLRNQYVIWGKAPTPP